MTQTYQDTEATYMDYSNPNLATAGAGPASPYFAQTSAPASMTTNLQQDEVLRLLTNAYRYSHERYLEQIPLLARDLAEVYQDGINVCAETSSDFAELLARQLRSEWETINAYNEHQLGDPINHETPLVDEHEAFPLRTQVMSCHNLVLDEAVLRPIYQGAKRVYNLSRKVYVDVKSGPASKKYSEEEAQKEAETGSDFDGSSVSQASAFKRKTGRGLEHYDKLADSPLATKPLPAINMTIKESATYHPQSIKSWALMDRFVANGGSQNEFAKMINHHRDMPKGPIEPNTVCRMMQGSMRTRRTTNPRYAKWTSKKHFTPNGFDKANIFVGGFSAPAQTHRGATASLDEHRQIKDLAKGVKVHPSGDDTLDLTRAVQYAMKHPKESWKYPEDVARLIETKLDGHTEVRPEHQDDAAIKRFKESIGKSNSGTKRKRQRADNDLATEQDAATGVKNSSGTGDSNGLRRSKRNMINSASSNLKRTANDDEEDDGFTQVAGKDPKRAKLTTNSTISSFTSVRHDDLTEEDFESGDEFCLGERASRHVASMARVVKLRTRKVHRGKK